MAFSNGLRSGNGCLDAVNAFQPDRARVGMSHDAPVVSYPEQSSLFLPAIQRGGDPRG